MESIANKLKMLHNKTPGIELLYSKSRELPANNARKKKIKNFKNEHNKEINLLQSLLNRASTVVPKSHDINKGNRTVPHSNPTPQITPVPELLGYNKRNHSKHPKQRIRKLIEIKKDGLAVKRDQYRRYNNLNKKFINMMKNNTSNKSNLKKKKNKINMAKKTILSNIVKFQRQIKKLNEWLLTSQSGGMKIKKINAVNGRVMYFCNGKRISKDFAKFVNNV
jgi:hypothetical protein